MLVEGGGCDSDSKSLQVGASHINGFADDACSVAASTGSKSSSAKGLDRRCKLTSSVPALTTLKLKLVQLKGVNEKLRRRLGLESSSVLAGPDLEEEESEDEPVEDGEKVNEQEGYDKEVEVALRITKMYEIALAICAGRCTGVDADDRNTIFQMLLQAISLSKDSSVPKQQVIDKIIVIDYIMSTIMSDCGTN